MRSRFINNDYGDSMNKLVCTFVAVGVLVGPVFAQSKTTKQPLRDSQMDGVTAGSAVAIADAAVISTDTGSVSLSGGALSGATGVNIVNSSDSLVANGVNVYDSSLTNQDSNKGATVNQVNAIKQTQATNATVAIKAKVVPLEARAVPLEATVVPLELAATATATATNIAADGAKIKTNNNDSVALAGTAEQNATALNIVNSAGGMVSNGVNIAHSANMNAIPTLNQVNITSQSR
jgi:hypothetical protein